jgi:hypothetical protein
MDSPFFVKKSDTLSVQNIRESLDLPKPLKRYAISSARQLQQFAGNLRDQDCFFVALDDYDKASASIEDYKKDQQEFQKNAPKSFFKQLPSQEKEALGVRMEFSTVTQEAYTTALMYREELICLIAEEGFLPRFKKAVTSLASSTNNEVAFFRKFLELKTKNFEAVLHEKSSIELLAELYGRIKISSPYLKTADTKPINSYIKACLMPVFKILVDYEIILQKDVRRQSLTAYCNSRTRYKDSYAAAIKELNDLLHKKWITASLCSILQTGDLLPGIEGDVKPLSPVAGSSTQKNISLEDLLEQDWVKNFSDNSQQEKGKNKKRTCTRVVQNTRSETISSPSLDQEKGPMPDELLSLGTCQNVVALPQAYTKSICSYPVAGNNLVRAWSLYKISHQNMEKSPKFPLTYSKNVIDWQKDPEGALMSQGYFDEESPKFQRANAFQNYESQDKMRDYMKIYHNFPLEIDEQVKNYGRVEMKLVKVKKGVDEQRIVITMAGELELKGDIKRGLFSYIIDPSTNTCYHRMFEPVEKSPLDSGFYDIYFMSAE